ncbi:NitT/TauT family transport system permease protein [Humitalea rosea]|uniref:NitT/TauT family transport system permease protein n=1 Tax=Humitalea rosea TaxID=990373 RepID=A0A2W7IS28_9PROT|nr:ABC transporter permease [Humitalea rosea]PZW48394.1 NitT/TauT family transport system permease protein [Humitalea rosea]
MTAALRGLAGGLILLLGWEAAVRLFAIPPWILPAPSGILATTWTARAGLLPAAGMTLAEATGGYAIGAVLGILLAILLSQAAMLRRVLLPVVVIINSVPVAAYAPLALLWFGTGATSKVIMVAFIVGFTVFLNALDGLTRVDPAGIALLRSFGAGRLSILWRLRLPSALPAIAVGLRVSTVRAMIVAIVTEMLGSQLGLGWTIFEAVLQIDFLRVWAAILVASVMSLAFFGAITLLERRVVFWK